MTKSDELLNPSKPLASAERKRRSRNKLRKTGAAEFSISLKGETLELIEFLGETWGIPRARVVSELLNEQVQRKVAIMQCLLTLARNGATQEDMDAFFREHNNPPIPEVTSNDSVSP